MEDRLKRFRVIFLILIVCSLPVVARLIQLQLVAGSHNYNLAERNRIRRVFVPAARGRIYDRQGVLLADVRPAFSVSVVPQELAPGSLTNLSRILGMDEVLLQKEIAQNLPPSIPIKIKRDVDLTLVTKIEEHASDLVGVIIEVEPWRRYRRGEVFAHVLGYEGEVSESELKALPGYRLGDYIGRSGIEAFYESFLRGKDGAEYLEVDCQGRTLGPLSEKRTLAPVPGRDVYLTLDARIQERAFELVKDYDRAAVIGIEPENGNVVCFISKPSFDPNVFATPTASEHRLQLFLDENSPLYNRVLQGRYPPGSTFKPAIVLAGLKAGLVDSTTVFSCAGAVQFGGRTFRCWKTHGQLALKGAIINSCDSYFYQLGRKVGIDRIAGFVKDAGITGPTGIDLPGEGIGFIPDSKWYERHGGYIPPGAALNLAIGQGEVLVTPLELACFFASIANDGKFIRPHLLQTVKQNGVAVEVSGPGGVKTDRAVNRMLDVSPAQIRFLQDALVRVVGEGTGIGAKIEGVMVAGKTGTAQNPQGKDHAWFVGYVKDRILFCVLLENAGMGGALAAPVVRELIQEYLRLNG
jgi:penicillin-binding protein 2